MDDTTRHPREGRACSRCGRGGAYFYMELGGVAYFFCDQICGDLFAVGVPFLDRWAEGASTWRPLDTLRRVR